MNKKQKEQNKTLRNIFLWLIAAMVIFILVFFIADEAKKTNYNGVSFKMIKEGQITLYQTTFPFYKDGEKIADYNFYLRTSPNELKDVPFNGNLTIKKNVVFNPNDELNCDGDGIIAVANIVQNLYGYLNATVIRDENATCDSLGRYSLINIKTANSTGINQTGNSCYDINVANCEILKATERYMLEGFVKINGVINRTN
ncbi:MAG: hypothetical protein AABY15_03695 [Nanoarchaeota archaeon]